MIIDSHAHLNDERLKDLAKNIVNDFEKEGLECCLIAGFDYPSSLLAVEQANKLKQYAIVGVHPHDSESLTESVVNKLRELAKDERVVAIGEIGLDYHYDDGAPKEEQIRAFKRQIILADELSLPVVLHVRDSYQDTLNVLKEYKQYLNNGILLHCYSSSSEMLHEFNKFDCYYALGGAITFKNAKKEAVIKAIPKDRLLVETDCPYLAPTPFRGQTNEPKYINYVVDKIAEVLGAERQEIIDLTNKNTKRLFRNMK